LNPGGEKFQTDGTNVRFPRIGDTRNLSGRIATQTFTGPYILCGVLIPLNWQLAVRGGSAVHCISSITVGFLKAYAVMNAVFDASSCVQRFTYYGRVSAKLVAGIAVRRRR
jgi:hypothetical protein